MTEQEKSTQMTEDYPGKGGPFDVRTAACPTCGAQSGEYCLDAQDNPVPWPLLHASRHRRWAKLPIP